MFRHKPKVTFSRLFCPAFHAPKPNQSINAETVGDQLNGEEWIVIPESISGAHFIVSYIDAGRFLQEFPNMQNDLDQTDTVEIKGISALSGEIPSNSDSVTLTIPVGGFVEVEVNTEINPDGSLEVTLGTSSVTIDSLILELDSYYSMGAIKNLEAYNGLRDKLIAAKSSIQSGKVMVAIKQLQAFNKQLDADRIVNPFARQALMSDTLTLIDTLSQE